ncbi:MAG: 2-C-methyl-D-erythritol 4-phosphate cytidylyltransferase, partial [Chloroflexia bacterium]|nr:2-C-methyl-D-erythritol 4-phosphate cytidylyltransferase [Chloroflexia bacterium]
FGPTPKVLAPLGTGTVLSTALATICRAPSVAGVVLVVGEAVRAAAERMVAGGDWGVPVHIVAGGGRRQDSTLAGLLATPGDHDVVVIHDGARPLVTPDLVEACAAAARRDGAAIAAVPVHDTLKRVDPGLAIVETVSRDGLWAAQTPQAFRRDLLLRAMTGPEFARDHTDEAGLFETLGWPVTVVPGAATNLKITRPDDLVLAAALLAHVFTAPDATATGAGETTP